MSQYFPKPFRSFEGDINVKVDLSNYATKTDLKNVTHVDTSSFALKANLANLKTEVDKLDIDKLAPVPVDLSKLSDVVKNDVVKKTVYDKLVAKVNNIDTSDFVLKTKYNTDKSELENKIPNVTDFVKKAKLTELENKIPGISDLATNETALTNVENKIPAVSNLVKKTDYNTKVTKIENKLNNHNHDKYIDTQEFNKLTAEIHITSIHGRPNFDEFPRHFHLLFRCNFDGRKIHVVSTYFFQCNFAGRKIHVVFTYFSRSNFDGLKIRVVSMYVLRCNFGGRKIYVVSTYFFDVICLVEICTLFLLTFFDVILMGKNSTSFLVSCKLMKTFEKVFPVFVTLNS